LRRNRFLKLVVQGEEWIRIEVKGRRGRIYKQLLVDRKDMTGHRKLKEETVDHIVWRIGLIRSYEPVLRQTGD